jgi:secreted trypsin-like serine protease
MPRQVATGLALLLFTAGLLAAPAHAVIKGSASSLGSYTVRLAGNGYCTGVVIARRAVVTAAHCAHGMGWPISAPKSRSPTAVDRKLWASSCTVRSRG